jgi:hypothetical protein
MVFSLFGVTGGPEARRRSMVFPDSSDHSSGRDLRDREARDVGTLMDTKEAKDIMDTTPHPRSEPTIVMRRPRHFCLRTGAANLKFLLYVGKYVWALRIQEPCQQQQVLKCWSTFHFYVRKRMRRDMTQNSQLVR